MKETLELGSVPADEPCAQLLSDNQLQYTLRAREECRAFINQLVRLYGEKHGQSLPHGIRLKIKSNAHDFGTYYEVAIEYDVDNDNASTAAFWLEQNSPLNWDAEALEELNHKDT